MRSRLCSLTLPAGSAASLFGESLHSISKIFETGRCSVRFFCRKSYE